MPRAPPDPSPGSATEGCCTLATKPYGCGHKCARNLFVQAVLTTLLLPLANWAQQPYIYFRQFNQFKPHYPLKDAIRMIFITLKILKLPFNRSTNEKRRTDNWSHSPKIDENNSNFTVKALQVPTHTPVVLFISLYVFCYLFHIYSLRFQVLFAKCCGKKTTTRKWLVKQQEWPACTRSLLPQKLGCLLFVLRIYCWFAFAFWSGYCSGSFQSFVVIMSFGDHTRLQHRETDHLPIP